MLHIEQLEQYLVANDNSDRDEKRAILLSSVGASTYKLLRNLSSPDSPKDKHFNQLVKLVKDHYEPTSSVIVKRCYFNSEIKSVYRDNLRTL